MIRLQRKINIQTGNGGSSIWFWKEDTKFKARLGKDTLFQINTKQLKNEEVEYRDMKIEDEIDLWFLLKI